jgi:hypothetical protein
MASPAGLIARLSLARAGDMTLTLKSASRAESAHRGARPEFGDERVHLRIGRPPSSARTKRRICACRSAPGASPAALSDRISRAQHARSADRGS